MIKFVMFCGYPRSGHSLVASILNAHPNCIISNQKNILKSKKFDKNTLFSIINEGSNSNYFPGDVTITPLPKEEIKVMGDKTGHRTIEYLVSYPIQAYERLEKIKETFGDIYWIHIVRNPFDNIATWTLKNNKENKIGLHKEFERVLEKYERYNEEIVDLKKKYKVLTLHHESNIRNTKKALSKICDFLEIKYFLEWEKRVKKKIWREPRETRKKFPWNGNKKGRIMTITGKYDWLGGYSFKKG